MSAKSRAAALPKKLARGLKAPTGAYLCGPCKRWHLTSKSPTQTPPWVKVGSVR